MNTLTDKLKNFMPILAMPGPPHRCGNRCTAPHASRAGLGNRCLSGPDFDGESAYLHRDPPCLHRVPARPDQVQLKKGDRGGHHDRTLPDVRVYLRSNSLCSDGRDLCGNNGMVGGGAPCGCGLFNDRPDPHSNGPRSRPFRARDGPFVPNTRNGM